MFNQDLLKRCSNARAISGFEGEMRALLRAELEGCGSFRTERSGNFVCSREGAPGAPTVALLAHMDEIGFMVQGVTEGGFLAIVPIGGWWNHTLPSQRVIVQARPLGGAEGERAVPGQIGTKPPHLLPESQRREVMPNDALYVDVGASSAEEVAELGIRPGCAVVPDVCLQPLAVPHRWMGKAFDNRAGVFCMLETMRRLRDEPLPCALSAVGTVQEEVGTRGARALECPPDLAIILEGPPADDTLGMSGSRQGVLGKGVQVRLYDPTNITPPALADWVLSVAAEEGVPVQPAVRRSGGTDAAASYPSWGGRAAIVFGIPTRYIHSHNGILDDRDLAAAVDLTCALIRRATPEAVARLLP